MNEKKITNIIILLFNSNFMRWKMNKKWEFCVMKCGSCYWEKSYIIIFFMKERENN